MLVSCSNKKWPTLSDDPLQQLKGAIYNVSRWRPDYKHRMSQSYITYCRFLLISWIQVTNAMGITLYMQSFNIRSSAPAELLFGEKLLLESRRSFCHRTQGTRSSQRAWLVNEMVWLSKHSQSPIHALTTPGVGQLGLSDTTCWPLHHVTMLMSADSKTNKTLAHG